MEQPIALDVPARPRRDVAMLDDIAGVSPQPVVAELQHESDDRDLARCRKRKRRPRGRRYGVELDVVHHQRRQRVVMVVCMAAARARHVPALTPWRHVAELRRHVTRGMRAWGSYSQQATGRAVVHSAWPVPDDVTVYPNVALPPAIAAVQLSQLPWSRKSP